jgi:hypothetical protein
MAAKRQYKLDLTAVLQAIDNGDFEFYSRLTEEEKKGYAPLVLMRYMSSLTDQSKNSAYAVIVTNEFANIGFWNISKHPELQHLTLCVAGLGGKQYRPWIPSKRAKKVGKIDDWLLERFPEMNEDELNIFKSSYDAKSWASFVKESGVPDQEVKEMIEAWKKQTT